MSDDNSDSPEEIAERIRDSFADEYQDHDIDSIAETVEKFQKMLGGENEDELRRAVTTSMADSLGVERGELLGVGGEGGGGGGNGADSVGVEAVKELGDEQWVIMDEVKAVNVEEHEAESIRQQGRLGDEDGTVRFVAWSASFDEPPLEEGETYSLDSVVTDEYEGRISVNLNSATDIEDVDADVEVGEDIDLFEGCLVSVNRERSGLIMRDQETGQYVANEEGVETEHDLRIMGVLDDGETTQDVVLDRELTEELAGIDLDEATEMAMEHLDRSVVADAMAERVLGRYYGVEGTRIGRYLNADEVEQLEEPEFDEELLIEARSMSQ